MVPRPRVPPSAETRTRHRRTRLPVPDCIYPWLEREPPHRRQSFGTPSMDSQLSWSIPRTTPSCSCALICFRLATRHDMTRHDTTARREGAFDDELDHSLLRTTLHMHVLTAAARSLAISGRHV